MIQPNGQAVTRTLEWERALSHARVSREFLYNTTLTEATDMITDQLVMTLAKEILTDKVLADETTVPVNGIIKWPPSFLVELPRTWWQRLLHRPARSVWCAVVGTASVDGNTEQATVKGHATVRADYFRTFPEAGFPYDERMGRSFRIVTAAPVTFASFTPGVQPC